MKCANCYDSVASMLADKVKVIETMTDELQTLRAKVASADVLVEALREITYSYDVYARKKAEQALATYDKQSEE